jgi:hypothetical protein
MTLPRLRTLTIRHTGSGAEKVVEYLGMSGIPLRAIIHWPIAGEYLVSPKTGTIIGDRKSAERLRPWRLAEPDLAFLREEYRRARANAQLPIGRLLKCQ